MYLQLPDFQYQLSLHGKGPVLLPCPRKRTAIDLSETYATYVLKLVRRLGGRYIYPDALQLSNAITILPPRLSLCTFNCEQESMLVSYQRFIVPWKSFTESYGLNCSEKFCQ